MWPPAFGGHTQFVEQIARSGHSYRRPVGSKSRMLEFLLGLPMRDITVYSLQPTHVIYTERR